MSSVLKCLVVCLAGLAVACGDDANEMSAPTSVLPDIAATPAVGQSIALRPSKLGYCFHPGSTRNCVLLKRSLRIVSISGAPLRWTALSNQPWIVVSPASGTTPSGTSSKVTVSMDLSKVPHMHGTSISGLVTVSAPRASNSPQTASVFLTFVGVPFP